MKFFHDPQNRRLGAKVDSPVLRKPPIRVVNHPKKVPLLAAGLKSRGVFVPHNGSGPAFNAVLKVATARVGGKVSFTVRQAEIKNVTFRVAHGEAFRHDEQEKRLRYRYLLEKKLQGGLSAEETTEYDAARASFLTRSKGVITRQKELSRIAEQVERESERIEELAKRYL